MADDNSILVTMDDIDEEASELYNKQLRMSMKPEATPGRILEGFWHDVRTAPGQYARAARTWLKSSKPLLELDTGPDAERLAAARRYRAAEEAGEELGDYEDLSTEEQVRREVIALGKIDDPDNPLTLDEIRREAHQTGMARQRSEIEQRLRKIETLPIFKPDERYMGISSGFLEDVARGFATSVVSMPAYFINPLFGTMMTGAYMHGAKVHELEDIHGVTDPNVVFRAASMSSLVQTPLEALSNLFMMSRMMKKTGMWTDTVKKIGRAMLEGFVGEGVTEFAQQYPDEFATLMALNPDDPERAWMQFKDKLLEITGNAAYAFMVGGVSGGLTVGSGRALVSMAEMLTTDKQKRINQQKKDRLTFLVNKAKDGTKSLTPKEQRDFKKLVPNNVDLDNVLEQLKMRVETLKPIEVAEKTVTVNNLRAFYGDDEIETFTNLWDGIARAWGEKNGKDPSLWYREEMGGVQVTPTEPTPADRMQYQALRVTQIEDAEARGLLSDESMKTAKQLKALDEIDRSMKFGGPGKPQPNMVNINARLAEDPKLVDKIRQIEIETGVKLLTADNKIVSTPIEERLQPVEPGKEGLGLGEGVKNVFPGLFRSFSQTWLDNMPAEQRDTFRNDIVKSMEHEYKLGEGKHLKKGLGYVSYAGKDQKTGKQTGFKINTALKGSHKTGAALNFNTQCPMFIIGAHGCYFDGCYVTGQAAAGQIVNYYRSAAYFGEILQLSDDVIDKLNKAGGLRINGMGDTQLEDYSQWRDVFRHAKMRKLKLKVITKQDATFQIIDRLQREEGLAKKVVVQPSIDSYWIPFTEDDIPGSAAQKLGIIDTIRKGDPKALEAAVQMYKRIGRDAKIIDGIVHRKYGYSLEQIKELSKKYPNIRMLPRIVVSTPLEIAEYALHTPEILQTWMHAKIRPGMYSDLHGRHLEEDEAGNFRKQIIIKKVDGEWRILAQAKAGDLEGAPHKVYLATEKFIKENYSDKDANLIFRRLAGMLKKDVSSLCCKAGADPDSCFNCTAGCATGAFYSGERLGEIADSGIEMIERLLGDRGSQKLYQTTAYHGTPHIVPKFATSKIGTGEGAQAFGWGLYFTDIEEIAEAYADMEQSYQIDGKPLKQWLSEHPYKDILYRGVHAAVKMLKTDIESAADWMDEHQEELNELHAVETIISYGKNAEYHMQQTPSLDDVYKTYLRMKEAGRFSVSRNVYKVTLHKGKDPSEYDWLDWNETVSVDQLDKLEDSISTLKEGANSGLYSANTIQGIKWLIDDLRNSVEFELKPNRKSKYALPEVLAIAKQFEDSGGDISLVLANDYEAYNALTSRFPELTEMDDWEEVVAKDVWGSLEVPRPMESNKLYHGLVRAFTLMPASEYQKRIERAERKAKKSGKESDWAEYERLSEEYERKELSFDPDKEASIFLLRAGIDGVRYPTGTLTPGFKGGEPGFNYVVFDENAITIEEHRMFQAQPAGPVKGAVRNIFNDAPKIIELYKAADQSTIIHETGHILLSMLANRKDADYFTVADWLGVDRARAEQGLDAWADEELEQFAESFERYIMEGKAPTAKLKAAFERLRAWLLEIYKSITQLGIEVSPEVQDVFDRLVASEFERENEPAADIVEWLNIDDLNAEIPMSEMQDYEAVRHEARRRVVKKAANVRKKKEKEFVADIEKLAKAMVDGKRVHEVIDQIIAQGGLDMEQLLGQYQEIFVGELSEKHPGLVKRNGLNAESFAIDAGYSNLEMMLDDILRTPTKEYDLRRTVDALMKVHEVEQMAENRELEHKALREEMRIVARILGKEIPKSKTKRIIEETAGEITDAELVELKKQYKRDQKVAAKAWKGARKATTAEMRKKADQKVLDLLETQRDRIRKIKEAEKGRRGIEKIRKRLGKYMKSKGMVPEIKGQMLAWLREKNYIDVPDGFLAGLPIEGSLEDFLTTRQEEDGYIVQAIRDELTDAPEVEYNTKTGNRKPMTLEQWTVVDRVCAMFNHMSQIENIIQLAEDKVAMDELMASLEAVAYGSHKMAVPGDGSGNVIEPTGGRSWKDKFRDEVSSYIAETRKIEFIMEELDGWKPGGPHMKLFELIAAAEAKKLDLSMELVPKIREVFGELWGQKGWANKKYDIGRGKLWSKEEILMAALNTGNEGNLTALRTAYGMTDEQIDAIKQILIDEGEWPIVQKVWNLIEELWPEVNALHKRLTGVNLEKVKGNYFPLVFDPKLSWMADKFKEEEALKEIYATQYQKPSVAWGHRHKRRGGKAAPLLSFSVLTRHLTSAIQDISHQEAVRNLSKVVMHPRFRQMVIDTMGEDTYRQFVPWLQHVARPQPEMRGSAEKAVSRIRKNTTVVALGVKLTVAMKQFLSFTQTIDAVGIKHSMAALGQFMANPKKMVEEINGMAAEMRNRRTSWDRELRDIQNRLDPKATQGLEKLRDAFFWMIGFVDMIATYPTFQAGYNKGMELYGDHDKAVAHGMHTVRTTQPVAGPKDLSMWQRGGKGRSEFVKLFTMFYTFFAQFQNRMIRTKRRYQFDDINTLQAFGSFMWLLVVPAMISSVIAKRRWPWDVSAAEYLNDIFAYGVAGMPIVRDFITPMITASMHMIDENVRTHEPSMSPVEGAGTSLYRLSKAIGKAVEQAYTGVDEDAYIQLLIRSTDVIGYGTGLIPSAQAITTMEGLLDLWSGETQDWSRLLLREQKYKPQ